MTAIDMLTQEIIKLKKEKQEMLDALIDDIKLANYDNKDSGDYISKCLVNALNKIELIEKATGLPIDEILKDS